jgi:hypothetical protein
MSPRLAGADCVRLLALGARHEIGVLEDLQVDEARLDAATHTPAARRRRQPPLSVRRQRLPARRRAMDRALSSPQGYDRGRGGIRRQDALDNGGFFTRRRHEVELLGGEPLDPLGRFQRFDLEQQPAPASSSVARRRCISSV